MKCLLSAVSLALLLLAGNAAAQRAPETLLVDRVHAKPVASPVRGLTMAQVEARYGAPTEKLAPRGGQKRAWPTINRWVYPEYTVYFEKSRVVDVVAHRASPDEIGPKPPIR
ncbi:hypothetical protein [Xanthomonas massiliensis]|jgi:hypothetical protein|uniref:hypothetical protein n=1 Tax=Xanthomonas massiliensis TaxID=1720302 RepID=UPI0008253213|nr:hypothetical protein [Xanthomonas massiliensis]